MTIKKSHSGYYWKLLANSNINKGNITNLSNHPYMNHIFKITKQWLPNALSLQCQDNNELRRIMNLQLIVKGYTTVMTWGNPEGEGFGDGARKSQSLWYCVTELKKKKKTQLITSQSIEVSFFSPKIMFLITVEGLSYFLLIS